MLCDPAALNHVLVSRSYDYPKPEEVRGDLAMILGKGILFAEGDDHRRQRRIMNPSFGPAHLRELVPTFFQYSHQLRDLWKELLDDEGSNHRDEHAFKDKESEDKYYASQEGRKEGERVLNVVAWLNKLTLDIIGDGQFMGLFFVLRKTRLTPDDHLQPALDTSSTLSTPTRPTPSAAPSTACSPRTPPPVALPQVA